MRRFLRALRQSWRTWWPVYVAALMILVFDFALYLKHHQTISQLIAGAHGKAKIALGIFFGLLFAHWLLGLWNEDSGV